MRKINVEIVFGFLASGKTKFINKYINTVKDEVHIIQFESGRTKIESNAIQLNSEDNIELNTKIIEEYIEKYKVKRLLIEWNGLQDPKKLYEILGDIDGLSIMGRRTVIDIDRFLLMYRNFYQYMELPIISSDLILLNESNQNIESILREKNHQAKIIKIDDFFEIKNIRALYMREKIKKDYSFIIISSILLYFLYNILFRSDLINIEDIDKLKGVLLLSFGIILEAIPFILLGVIISSLIQLFLTERKIEKLIPKNKILGVFYALILGFIFPVCDCASIPIASRMIKKKIPIYISLIFMLSSPIINPTVLLATFYAFKDIFPQIVEIRLIMGIIISIIIGSFMHIVFKDKDIFKSDLKYLSLDNICNCDYCTGYNEKRDIYSLFRHIINEFISVCKYLILGSLLAAIFQILLPIEFIYNFSEKNILSVVIMVIFSYLISLCSTSDSFVAKAFFLRMSTISIIAFLISGPMIDIKNTMILSGIFKKKFTLILVISILLVTIIGSLILDRLFVFY
ncbi:MAG: permease [Andreesenia angusta]|nr:permease [Andreesenia angusta]